MRARGVLAGTVAVATAAVVALSVADPRPVVPDAPAANVAIQTTAALVAGLVAVAAYGRFRVRRRAADALLVLALVLLAAPNALFTALPLARDAALSSEAVWAAAVTRLAGVVALIAAAHVPARWVVRPRHAGAAVAAVATGVVIAAHLAAGSLPASDLATPGRRVWEAAPALAAVLGATALAAAVAARGFTRRYAAEPRDELLAWLGVSAVVAAGAHAATAGTYVSTFSSDVSVGDLLKLLAYVVLLGGLVREIGRSWREHDALVVAEERRRIARDLHDGLAQELAFVVSASRRIARRGDADLWDVCWAAERALDESRLAIAALTRDGDEPLDVSIARAAEEVAGRAGSRVTFELESVEVPDDVRDALLRITREAVTNAVRHGAATRVHVRLSRADGVRLRVSDNGRGFDPTAPRSPGRLGIAGMCQRAEALGGAVSIAPARPTGTDVEVVLP